MTYLITRLAIVSSALAVTCGAAAGRNAWADATRPASRDSSIQTSPAPSTPTNFRLVSRTGARLRFNWDWVSGGVGAIHYELSYADRTIVLNQYYPGHTRDVSDLDLSPDHSYTFSLRAIDEAGNASGGALLLFETTPPDPPSNLQQLSTRQGYPDLISFNLSRDNAGPIRAYEAIVAGRSFGPIPGAVPPNSGRPREDQFSLFELVFSSYTSVPTGPTTVQLRAYDGSLNASALSPPLTVIFP